ncbi:ATP-binding cassette sub-family C member 4-like [Eschrichtius robustus]|uniref:ATP-binding cassette sub-family C member 4-like n=1 Tax=Eschrichtius robustus TaxID=9764 RepID=UPI0035C256EA
MRGHSQQKKSSASLHPIDSEEELDGMAISSAYPPPSTAPAALPHTCLWLLAASARPRFIRQPRTLRAGFISEASAAAGAPLQVPAERRRPGLQTPRQRWQDAAGEPGGAAQLAAGREPLLPPVLLNFLLLDEISQCNPQLPSDGKTIVDVQDFTAFWDEDLEVLEDGDLTVIGDRGTTLSGGQKARVSLARAVYQDADIYLLDDPLSAVDAEVSRHLLELCIRQALHKKITILVTHQLQYLKDASQILVLKDTENIQVRLPLESYSEGRVHFKTYMNYFTSDAHWLIIIFFILVNIAARVAYVLQDWWLSYWANGQSTLYAMVYGKGNLIVVPDPDWYFTVYSVLTVGTVLFGITRSLLIFCVLVNSSQIWHDKMLESILRVPVLFFDTNPIGRILNRFSKDIGHMDDLLPLTFLDFIQTFLLVTGVMVHAAGVMVAVIPWTAIPLVPLGIIFFVLRQYFLETSGDVKRLECATRSLVFSHLASSLRGLWTIRANNAEQKFQEVFDTHQDLHSEAWLLLLTTSRWLAVRLDAICAILVTVVAFVSLILAETLDAGRVGLALSLALTLMGMTQWCIRQSVKVENMMISVERVIEYTDLEKEAPWKYFFHRLPPAWPHEGKIFFQNINLRYSLDGPLVLKDLTAVINSREKAGIVGRTGAGKSSLIAALFRLLEPEGEISIDGILTTIIGFHHLRKKMSVVPQEPVLFTGTMRKNLDPFNEHMDEELWNALEECHPSREALKSVIYR